MFFKFITIILLIMNLIALGMISENRNIIRDVAQYAHSNKLIIQNALAADYIKQRKESISKLNGKSR